MSKRHVDELYAIIRAWAAMLYRLSLHTHLSPMNAQFGRETSAPPRVGDLVIEVSGIYCGEFNPASIGRFVRQVHEPVPDWDDALGAPNPGDDYTYITRLDTGEEIRWENCRFARLPDSIDMVKEWLGA